MRLHNSKKGFHVIIIIKIIASLIRDHRVGLSLGLFWAHINCVVRE